MLIDELIRAKEDRGYSLKQISDVSGVAVVTLQKIFTRKTKHPRKKTLDAIAAVLMSTKELQDNDAYSYSADEVKPDMIKEVPYDYGDRIKKRQTVDDYYHLPDDRRAELIDGHFYDMAPPSALHQEIVHLVDMAFSFFIMQKGKDCTVFESPIGVQIGCDDYNMLEPDLIVVCQREKIQRPCIYGAPDFVLEVLSPSNRKLEMTKKLAKYAEHGVREYWIIDPIKMVVVVHSFEDPEYLPMVHPMEGKLSVAISGGELEIDLDQMRERILLY